MKQQHIKERIQSLLKERGPDKSICPSDVARSLKSEDWRNLMEPVREAARQMAREGKLRITQGEQELDPDETFNGPVRLRMPKEEA